MRGTPAPAPETDATTNVVLIREHRAIVEFARTLSTIFNPFLTASALFIIVSHASSRSTAEFWLLSLAGLFFFTLAPVGCLLFLYVTGRISDFDLSERSERKRVFMAFVVIYIVTALVLTLAHAPPVLIAITWGYLGTAVATMIITRYWKISTHAFGIAGSLAALTVLFRDQTLPYLALIPLVCWARIYLRAHTVAQVIAGATLGVASTLFFFKLFHII